jgi:ribonuclease P protein subunit RPR2
MKRQLSLRKQKEIARERIRILFTQAKEIFQEDAQRAHRYVEIARKIAMKAKVRIPREFKRQFCRHCYRFLMPSVNARIRTRKGKVIIYCKECKKFTRIPLGVKQKTHEKR